VNAADVKVHIEYGFGGFRRLDLEAYTNADGQLKFTGLPAKVRNPPLAFEGARFNLAESRPLIRPLNVRASTTCHSRRIRSPN